MREARNYINFIKGDKWAEVRVVDIGKELTRDAVVLN